MLLHKKNVLLVLKDEGLGQFLRKQLEKEGAHVSIVPASFHALKFLEEEGNSIDIFVTDFSLSNYDGVDLIHKIHGQYPIKKYLILSFEADLNEKIKMCCQKYKNVYSLLKPFGERTFIKMVDDSWFDFV